MFLVCLLLKKDGESLVNNFLFQRAAKLSFSTDGSISLRFVFFASQLAPLEAPSSCFSYSAVSFVVGLVLIFLALSQLLETTRPRGNGRRTLG